jgi:hypothetical protein
MEGIISSYGRREYAEYAVVDSNQGIVFIIAGLGKKPTMSYHNKPGM